MLGWHFNVYARPEGELEWKKEKYSVGLDHADGPLCSWASTLGGLDWLNHLVSEDLAVLHATNGGYPFIYETSYMDAAPFLASPPCQLGNSPKALDLTTTTPTPRLIIEVWDQS